MKIRVGFVSNSSSSSFAVFVPAERGTKFTVEVDVADYGEVLRTREDVERVLGDEWNHRWPPWLYEDALRAIEEGKVVVVGEMTNDECLGGDRGSRLLYDSLHGVVRGDGVEAYEIG